MRRILKGREPEDLFRWRKDNARVPQNLTYANMPKTAVKQQMLSEQGYLCAYTMQSISTIDDCQIEHIVPRNQDPLLQTDYANLLACAPSNRPGHRPERGKCPYGAEKKNHTHVNADNFVSPLQQDVEQRFRYALDGSVATSGNDTAAESTIKILRLDHEQLKDLRRAAIDEWVFPPDQPLSAEEAESLSLEIMNPNISGRLPQFCLAISQVAAWYANRLIGRI